MDQANYILKFQDGRLVPKNESAAYNIVKKLAFVFVVLLAAGSLLFREFLLSELSFTTWGCIVVTAVYLVKNGGHTRERCYTELQFYDDYLIQYVPRHYFSKKNIRKEYYKIFYKDIKECTYRTSTQKVVIFGMIEGTFYKYGKNGEIEQAPSYHKTADTMAKFYTVFEPDIDFVKEIETHSPIKVNMQNA